MIGSVVDVETTEKYITYVLRSVARKSYRFVTFSNEYFFSRQYPIFPNVPFPYPIANAQDFFPGEALKVLAAILGKSKVTNQLPFILEIHYDVSGPF